MAQKCGHRCAYIGYFPKMALPIQIWILMWMSLIIGHSEEGRRNLLHILFLPSSPLSKDTFRGVLWDALPIHQMHLLWQNFRSKISAWLCTSGVPVQLLAGLIREPQNIVIRANICTYSFFQLIKHNDVSKHCSGLSFGKTISMDTLTSSSVPNQCLLH